MNSRDRTVIRLSMIHDPSRNECLDYSNRWVLVCTASCDQIWAHRHFQLRIRIGSRMLVQQWYPPNWFQDDRRPRHQITSSTASGGDVINVINVVSSWQVIPTHYCREINILFKRKMIDSILEKSYYLCEQRNEAVNMHVKLIKQKFTQMVKLQDSVTKTTGSEIVVVEKKFTFPCDVADTGYTVRFKTENTIADTPLYMCIQQSQRYLKWNRFLHYSVMYQGNFLKSFRSDTLSHHGNPNKHLSDTLGRM